MAPRARTRVPSRRSGGQCVARALGTSIACAATIACGEPAEPGIAAVEITPARRILTALGDTVRLLAGARGAGGETIPGQTFSWSSSNPGVATVDPAGGLVTALANGAVEIVATSGDRAGSASITVAQTPATVAVTPDTGTLSPGDTLALAGLPLDARGNAMPQSPVTWATSDSLVLRVGAGGVVRAVGSRLGTATIRALSGPAAGQTRIGVSVTFLALGGGPSSGATCAMAAGAASYCWGTNNFGQLGTGTTSNSSVVPALVAGTDRLVSITAGAGHACGLNAEGKAYCWGRGVLGNLTTAGSARPVAVAGDLRFGSLGAGFGHTCGVADGAGGGEAYCWGDGIDGELGTGSTVASTAPALVAGGLVWVSVTVGGLHSCGITTDSLAFCWGSNAFGQLGDGSTVTMQTAPVAVQGGLKFVLLTAGYYSTCGITASGQSYCWGTMSGTRAPVPVSGTVSFASLTAGAFHTCGLSQDGKAYCWGQGSAGQLGTGSTGDSATPAAVSGDWVFWSLTAGQRHTCGITPTGAGYCWGENFFGALGDGTTTNRLTPVLVSGSRP